MSESGNIAERTAWNRVRNDISGSASGPVVQAGSVGQIHYHLHDYEEHALDHSPVIPAQLPRGPRHFTSRQRELADLSRRQSRRAQRPPLTVISGPAGVGKTTLALHWLHARDQFPDGQLYVDLGGFSTGGPVDPADVLEWFLAALEVPARRIPDDLAARAALYRSVTQRRSIAVLLDNAASAAQVRPLLPAGQDTSVLVTSRWRLTGLAMDGADFIDVDPLDLAASVELLGCFVDRRRADSEPEAMRQLADLCAGLPIALSVAGARLATRPRRSVAREVTELRAHPSRLTAAPADRDQSVFAVFDSSYDNLSDEAGRLFRIAALHPGPRFGIPVLSAALDQPAERVEEQADLLAEANLLVEAVEARFGFHDLLRMHARERAERDDRPEDRETSVRRMVEWYLNNAVAADLLVHPLRPRLGPRYAIAGADRELFATDDEALSWLETERDNVIAAAVHADWRNWDDLVWQFCEALWGMFLHSRRYDGWIMLQKIGIGAARRCADHRAEARMHAQLGFAYAKLGRYAEAVAENTAGLSLAEQAGDGPAKATALSQLGRAARGAGDLRAAIDYFRKARDFQDELGIEREVALSCRRIGEVLLAMHQPTEAVPELRRAVSIMTALEDGTQRARSLMFLARAQRALGSLEQAAAALHSALELMRRLGSSYYQAEILAELGSMAAESGDLAAARRHLAESCALYQMVEDPAADRIREELAALPPV